MDQNIETDPTQKSDAISLSLSVDDLDLLTDIIEYEMGEVVGDASGADPDSEEAQEAASRLVQLLHLQKRLTLALTNKTHACADCSVNTSDIDEYYMVHDAIWAESLVAPDAMLCIKCLEARIGRQLKPTDFTDAPINHGAFGHSDLLQNRLGLKSLITQ
jgi:hypothetical protein